MKYTQLRAFEKHLEGAAPQQHFSPIYLIIGKERFLCKDAVDKLLAMLLREQSRELSLTTLDGASTSPEQLANELQAFSLFTTRRVLWIDQIDKLSKPVLKELESYFEHPNPSLYLILSGSTVNHSTNFYKKGEKTGVVLDFAEEKPWEKEKQAVQWLMSQATATGKRIDIQACQHLVIQIGTDAALLHHELQKLLCYVGERDEITLKDIGAICTTVNVETGWQLGEALFRRDASSALRISKALLDEGTVLIALLRQIRHQFQTEYQICSILHNGGSAQEVSQRFPYMRGAILDRHLQLAREYGMNRFKAGMLTLDAAELAAKNSTSDDELLAELVIAKLVTANG